MRCAILCSFQDHPLEGDQPTLNATATVVITIEDGDDQNPVFYHPDECLGYVEESSPTVSH